jgi:dolichol-phosphate mannosyltransferase
MYTLSIIIPTYNESDNIIRLIERIKENLNPNIFTEIIVVDDNSPDGTGKIVKSYIDNDNTDKEKKPSLEEKNIYVIHVIIRKEKNGLIPAILEGVRFSQGNYILVMDADFSHPPELIPNMLEKILTDSNSIVIASRYVETGAIVGWPFRRRIISKCAAIIAKIGLRVNNVTDPMSGFFVVPRSLLEHLKIDTKGYKILLEILVKTKNMPIHEVPYTFTDRKSGKSKMGFNVVFDYIGSVWQLYNYGRENKRQKK